MFFLKIVKVVTILPCSSPERVFFPRTGKNTLNIEQRPVILINKVNIKHIYGITV